MKVLIINGSPHHSGATYTALHEVEKILNQEDIETIWINVPHDISSCLDCDYCNSSKKGCIKNDIVNDVLLLLVLALPRCKRVFDLISGSAVCLLSE